MIRRPGKQKRRRLNHSTACEQLEQRALLTSLYVAPTGDDGAAGTAGAPFATIQHALDRAAELPGDDQVRLFAGEYQQSATVRDDSGSVTIEGLGNVTIHGENDTASIAAEGSASLIVRNLTLASGTYGFSATGDGVVSLINVNLTANGKGAYLSEFSGSAYFKQVNATDNLSHGLHADKVGRLQLLNSQFSENGGPGILARRVNKTLLQNVTASSNGHRGLNVHSGRYTEIENSQFDKNGHDGVRVKGNKQDLVAKQLLSRDNRSDGLDLDSISSAITTNLTITGNRHDGLEADDFDGDSSIEVSQATISGNGSEGVTVRGVDTVSLDGVRANDNGDDGFDLVDGHTVHLTNFTADRNGQRGIHICVFDSIEISRGNANDNESSGVQILAVEDTDISNVRIANNTAEQYGGGIFVSSGGSLTLRNATLENNAAEFGGGLYVSKLGGASTVVDSTIARNSATATERSYGGGVYTNSQLTLERVAVNENTVSAEKAAGGGVYVTGKNGSLSALNTTIANNVAAGFLGTASKTYYALGGGIYIGLGAQGELQNTAIRNNTATMDYSGPATDYRSLVRGGGLYKNSSAGTVALDRTVQTTGNHAEDGGGVYGSKEGLLVATDALFSANSSLLGTDDKGGVWQDT